MNFDLLSAEAIEMLHESIAEANQTPQEHDIKGNADWRAWRDVLEEQLGKRGIEFEHIVLDGEET